MKKSIIYASLPFLLIVYCSLIAYPARAKSTEIAVLKVKIESTQHLGAHGFGYNDESLVQLSERLHAEDTPYLLEMLKEMDTSTEASFGLASLCQTGLDAIEKTIESKNVFQLGAMVDSLNHMIGFQKCDKQTKDDAAALISRINEATERRLKEAQSAYKLEQENIQRDNLNSLKMLDMGARKNTTKEEREEVFNRSVKAMGLDGNRTPEQETLYQKMYKTMVKQQE